ncbi:hypothetical protein PF008_g21215, partial [Phytophthora fragariae]
MMRVGISQRSRAHVVKSAWRAASSRGVSDWCSQTLLTASAALDRGDVSAVQLTQACIQQVESTRAFNMFVATDFEHALELARASDER